MLCIPAFRNPSLSNAFVPVFEATSRARDVSKIGKKPLHEHCKSRMVGRILGWWDINLSTESAYVHFMVVSGA